MSKRKRRSETAEVMEQASVARIELFGNKKALIEGCNGILEYSSEKIKLDTGKKAVVFSGLNLSMRDFNLVELSISGDIMSIEFCD